MTTTATPPKASVPGEIADAIVNLIETPSAQSALVAAITAGEVPLEGFIDSAISKATGSGALGLVIAAIKGSVETEINAEFAKLPATTIAAWLTSLAVDEAHNLGG